MKFDRKTCFRIGLTVFLVYLCIHYWSSLVDLLLLMVGAAQPLIVGCIIAYLVNILMSSYERLLFGKVKRAFSKKCRRPVCMLLAFFTLIAVVGLIVWLVLPQLTSCVQIILAEIPGLFSEFVAWVETLGVLPEDIMATLSEIDWRSSLEKIIGLLTTGLGSVFDVLVTTVSSVFSWTVTALVSIIFAIYILAGKERIAGQLKQLGRRYVKPGLLEKAAHVLDTVDDCFHRFIVGQCTEALILGLLCVAGMLIFRFPYATMIGALIGFTALIPVAGAYIGGALGAFMILTVSPVKALLFIVFLVVLQQLEGNLVYPRVVGSSIGLPGVWVLAAVTIGGGIMGVSGMLLGVPLAAAAYRLLREDVRRQKHAKLS